MLIHLVPKLYLPNAPTVSAEMLELKIVELGMTLRGGLDIDVRRPYPNKSYRVACKRIGQKAMDGILVRAPAFMRQITTEATWLVNGTLTLKHRIERHVLDEDLDATSDKMTLWYSSRQEGFEYRWPSCYAALSPVDAQPRMDLLSSTSRPKHDSIDTVSESGFVVSRTERFEIPTIESARINPDSPYINRIPPMHHTFTC